MIGLLEVQITNMMLICGAINMKINVTQPNLTLIKNLH